MTKRPSFQFYPGDWRNDAGLRLCSLPARGLWIEMMCLMHEGEPYGHLTVKGRPIDAQTLARLIGESPTFVKKMLRELEEGDVFSRTSDGIIFSRRMVRDEGSRSARAEAGKANGNKGAAFGHLGAEHGKKGGRPRKETPRPATDFGENNPPEKPPQNPHPSSSSSSSSPSIPFPDGNGPDVEFRDPEKVMFDGGLRLLSESGVAPARARPILGKWKRDFGAEAVIVALGKAKREGALDPISFIEGCLKNAANRGNRSGSTGLGRTAAAALAVFGPLDGGEASRAPEAVGRLSFGGSE